MLLFRAFFLRLFPFSPSPFFFPSISLFLPFSILTYVFYREMQATGTRFQKIIESSRTGRLPNSFAACWSNISRRLPPCRAPTVKLYVLLGDAATNKLTVEKFLLYTNVIYNIHIYNLGVDACTRVSSKVTAGTRVHARTRARVQYTLVVRLFTFTLSLSFLSLLYARLLLPRIRLVTLAFAPCVCAYYLYILSCIDLSIRKWYVSAFIRTLA